MSDEPSPGQPRWFGKTASDVCVGMGFIAAGAGALWYFGTTGIWPSTGGAKEWVAIGYGGFRLVRGLTNLGSSSA